MICFTCYTINVKLYTEHITKKALCNLRKNSKFSIKQNTGWRYKLATEPRSLNRALFIKSKIYKIEYNIHCKEEVIHL